METSSYFLKAMYFDQSPSSADYFEERSSSIFVSDSLQSWIECCIFNASPQSGRTPRGPQDPPPVHDSKPVQSLSRDEFWDNYQPDGANETLKHRSTIPKRVTQEQELASVIQNSEHHTRIFFIRQRNSFSRLSITRSFFDCLSKECEIFPQIRDFVLCFGSKSGENEIAPPRIRIRSVEATDHGRYWNYECAYVLRFVELNHRGNEAMPWSSRQFAVYHKFESVHKSSTWVFIALSQRAQIRLEEYTECCGGLGDVNPFEVHLLMLNTAISNWRQYMIYLTAETNERAARVIAASVDEESLIRVTEFTERQRLKQIDDDLLDVLAVLNSTLDTIASLRLEYLAEDLQQALGYQNVSSSASDAIIFSLQQQEKDVRLYCAKAENLRAKVAGTTELVSNLLDLGNGHSLKMLAEEARSENSTMRELAERGYRDAVAIKILTIATLIYLPATVVSNFFSTQFVSQVATPGGSSTKLAVASNWWIFVAASVPLTVITLYVWWFYVQKQAYGRYPRWFTLLKTWLEPISRLLPARRDVRSGTGYVQGRELHDRLEYSPASPAISNARPLDGLRSI